jgi:hypothetical protein
VHCAALLHDIASLSRVTRANERSTKAPEPLTASSESFHSRLPNPPPPSDLLSGIQFVSQTLPHASRLPAGQNPSPDVCHINPGPAKCQWRGSFIRSPTTGSYIRPSDDICLCLALVVAMAKMVWHASQSGTVESFSLPFHGHVPSLAAPTPRAALAIQESPLWTDSRMRLFSALHCYSKSPRACMFPGLSSQARE